MHPIIEKWFARIFFKLLMYLQKVYILSWDVLCSFPGGFILFAIQWMEVDWSKGNRRTLWNFKHMVSGIIFIRMWIPLGSCASVSSSIAQVTKEAEAHYLINKRWIIPPPSQLFLRKTSRDNDEGRTCSIYPYQCLFTISPGCVVRACQLGHGIKKSIPVRSHCSNL